jgi:hypothetical protein
MKTFIVLIIFTLIGFKLSAFAPSIGKWMFLLVWAIAFLLIPAVAYLKNQQISNFILRGVCALKDALKANYESLIAAMLTLYSLRTLPKFIDLKSVLDLHPVYTVFGLILIAIVSLVIVKDILRTSPSKANETNSYLSYIPYAIFLILSARSDYFGIDRGIAYHWEYYVGPIRTLRDGGWLLWDTPSQYGFLSVLLPSLIPVNSALEAFYFFQAFILFACASFFYFAITTVCNLRKILATLLVISAFFFSDTSLVGPGSYPSSSGMRFVGCYALLCWASYIFIYQKESIQKYISKGTYIWIFAVLWSAESAIYSSTIFLAPIALYIYIGILSGNLNAKEYIRLIRKPAIAFILILSLISFFYWLKLGHLPDKKMFTLYGNAYASGFGAVSITTKSAIWFFVVLLALPLTGLFNLLSSDFKYDGRSALLIAAIGCIWSTSSYYLGRAVPNNIVALYPLLVFSILLVIRTSTTDRMVTTLVCCPILVLALSSIWMNSAAIPFPSHLSFSPRTISNDLWRPDTELGALLNESHVEAESPVVYYGYQAMPPAIFENGIWKSREHTWLPSPLQLLEYPISAETRALILKRYITRNGNGGWLIQRKEENEDRFQDWISLLEKSYSVDKVAESKNYRIYKTQKSDKSPPKISAIKLQS